MSYPKSTINWKGDIETVTWIRTGSLDKFKPITQVFGVCFNPKNEILICRADKNDDWHLPGGKPEPNEGIKGTLKREFLEEVDAKIKNIKILGIQKVEFPGDVFYQARCICELEALLPQTPDPATGKTLGRSFVPISEVGRYIKWGKIGNTIFRDAIDLYKTLR